MIRIALLSGALLLALPVQAATVISVGDGDTITVTNDAQKIRMPLKRITTVCID